jgi:hypothetical protein
VRGVAPYSVAVDARSGAVEAWSARRLPFEPKGWLLQLRSELQEALKRLGSGNRTVLSAVYASPERRFCDAENVLIYNVGPAHLSDAAASGLRVERCFECPAPPSELEAPPKHYWRYRAAPVEEGFSAWQEHRLVAAWSHVPIPALTASTKPAVVWYALRCAPMSVATSVDPTSGFGLRLTLGVPPGERIAPASIVKPLVDGAIAALHTHDGSTLGDVSERIRRQLRGASRERIAALLADARSAALGRRRLLWPRARGVQWNPADDLCLALELRIERGERRELSGRLLEIKPRRAFAR